MRKKKHCISFVTVCFQIGISAILAVQKQQKRVHKKIKVDPTKQGRDSRITSPSETLCPGDRPDNTWHKYDSKKLPDTQEKWEQLVVVEKTHWGYYSWPKLVNVKS